MTAKEIIAYMESLQNEEQRRVLMGFFKTGPGEYGEGDEFLGLKVPQTREVVKAAWKDFPLDEVPELLMSKWHEVRLCGLLILVAKFERLTKRAAARTPLECTERTGTERTPLECTETIKTPLECAEEAIRGRDEILTMYLQYAERANNWDLVDLSVPKILGHWLLLPTNLSPLPTSPKGAEICSPSLPTSPRGGDSLQIAYKRQVLDELAQSDNLWKQRMSMVCSWKTSQMGDPSWCLRYAEIHLHHPHDLMHKAVGWMLREMGKRVSMDLLRDFLRQHAHEMPRTMLRYAIEKMSEQERQYWMAIPQAFAPAKKSKANRFAGIPVSDFVEMILMGDDEAMYYLLHDRLKHPLHERYEAYNNLLCDDYEDIIDDFFLYLRECGRYPYEPLKRIKKKESFETWLLNTFRNYLSNRAEAEGGVISSQPNCEAHALIAGEGNISDEEKIRVVSQLIAYAHQVFYPRGRFIFLRSLLTMLNKQRAVPNKEMAEALDMSDLAYRVAVYRMKQNVRHFRNRLHKGETLRLDEEHQQMADNINRDFIHLYPMLFRIYLECIGTLKTSTAVKDLRQQYLEERGFAVHEPDADSPIRVRIPAFWEKLNRWMTT